MEEITLERLLEKVEDCERRTNFLIEVLALHFPDLKEKIQYL